MTNPFQRYIQLLMPLVTGMDGCGTTTDGAGDESPRQPLDEMMISIVSDNARPLRGQDSMTMRSLQEHTSVKMCRWSSVPNLIEMSLAASSSSIKGTPRKSNDDLTRVMLNNSRIPRSTDDLRRRNSNHSALAGRSLRRWSDGLQDTASRRNGHWDINKSISKLDSPFDLRMPGLPVNATVPVQPAFLVLPDMKLKSSPKTHIMKIPERQASNEVKRGDNTVDSQSGMQLLLRNLKEVGKEVMKIPERKASNEVKRGDNIMVDSQSGMQLPLKNLAEVGKEVMKIPERKARNEIKRGDNIMVDSKHAMQLLLKNLKEVGKEATCDRQAVTENRNSPLASPESITASIAKEQ